MSASPTADAAPGEVGGLPELADPPIEEVVCGVVFAPLEALDALEQGVYWSSVAERFPKKQLQPPIFDDDSTALPAATMPTRSWLIADAEDLLVQIQHDRFYMNWRKRDTEYPRFRDRPEGQGLCTRALGELDALREFIRTRHTIEVEVLRVELQKQDFLLRGKHWSDFRDLARLLPVVDTFASIQTTDKLGINLRMVESDEPGTTTLQIATRMDHDRRPTGVRLDFHCSAPLQGRSLREAFELANHRINRMFFGLVAPDQLHRFGGPRS
jgi:uncharacterized protein (TIGR04255 family)